MVVVSGFLPQDSLRIDNRQNKFEKRELRGDGQSLHYTTPMKKAIVHKRLPNKIRFVLKGHKGAIYTVRFDSDGQFLMSAGEDRSVRLWNAQEGTLIKSFTSPKLTSSVLDLIISNNRKKFITADSDGRVHIWDTLSGIITRTLYGPRYKANSISWNKDETVLVCGSDDGAVYVWDLLSLSPHPSQILRDAIDSISQVLVAGPTVIAASVDGYLRVYDFRNGKLLLRNFNEVALSSVALSKDTRLFLVNCLDSSMRLIDRETGDQLLSYEGHINERYRIHSSFAWDNSVVLSPSEDGDVVFWDLVNGTVLHRIKHGTGLTLASATHPKVRVIATAGEDGVLKVWVVDHSS